MGRLIQKFIEDFFRNKIHDRKNHYIQITEESFRNIINDRKNHSENSNRLFLKIKFTMGRIIQEIIGDISNNKIHNQKNHSQNRNKLFFRIQLGISTSSIANFTSSNTEEIAFIIGNVWKGISFSNFCS